MVFLHFDFDSIMNSSLVIHQRNFNCKKKKSQKVTSFTRKIFFANFVFYNSDTQQAHLYLNDFCQLSYTLQVQKKKNEI